MQISHVYEHLGCRHEERTKSFMGSVVIEGHSVKKVLPLSGTKLGFLGSAGPKVIF